MKKYMDVTRHGKSGTHLTIEGNPRIVIQEKLDGANASFKREGDKILCFSRNTQLDEHNTLRGFYNWVQENIKAEDLVEDGIYFGEWLCLSGDTVIRKTSGGRGTSNYMTLREMYEFNQKKANAGHFVKENGEKVKYYHQKSQWEKQGYPSLFSLDIDKDIILPNKMTAIVFSGYKTVYELTTRKGYKIKSTKEHRFFTPHGFKRLEELDINDCVAVTPLRSTREPRRYGKGARKLLELFAKLKEDNNCDLCNSDSSLEIHHKDGNWKNNDLSNLQVLCAGCHAKLERGIRDTSHNGYEYEFDKIISIVEIGEEDVYDISMQGDENLANFIANGFVVHNCKHKLSYGEHENKFYLFDIYDTETERYIPFGLVKGVAEDLNLNLVPVFYDGEFQSIEHIQSFVGKSQLGETGEGVVVKNVNYEDKYGRQQFTKFVSDQFAEMAKTKKHKVNTQKDDLQEFVNASVNKARVSKIIHKLVDEGLLKEDYAIEDMGTILKNTGSKVFDDVIKEELDELLKLLKSKIGRKVPTIVKEVLIEEGRA